MGNKIDNAVKIPVVHTNPNHSVKQNIKAANAVTPAKANNSSQVFNAGTMNFKANVLKTKLNANVPAQVTNKGISDEKIKFLREHLMDAGHLGIALASPDFNKDVKPNQAESNKLIGEIIRSKDAERLLLDYGLPNSPRNITYDQQKAVAGAVGDAYKAGEVSDADLKDLATRLGPEKTANLIMTLANDPNNTKAGGVVEALGKQAKDLGYKQAAALAFTSSDELIKKNLPTSADRKAAFGEVKSFIDKGKDNAKYNQDAGAQYNSQLALAVGNAARLTAMGDGYNQKDFDNLLKDLGPRVTNEVIARATAVEGDGRKGGALDILGQTSERIAAGAKGDDKRKWEVNTAVAYTSSPELIKTHLDTPEKRMQAFDTLNKELYRQRGNVKDALKFSYSLLGQPAAASGMANLLATNGKEILEAKIGQNGQNYKGQADLAQFLQSTVYSPLTDAATRQKIESSIGDYVNNSVEAGKKGDVFAGERIGALLGVSQVALDRGVKDAQTPEQKSKLEQIADGIAKAAIGKLGETLLAETGPIGSYVGGKVLDKVLEEVFGDHQPSPEKLGEAFIEALKKKGVDIQGVETHRDGLVNAINEIEQALNKARDGATSQKEINDITKAYEYLETLKNAIRHRLDETDTSGKEPNRKLNEELKNWKP
jgi:hypothetical protein